MMLFFILLVVLTKCDLPVHCEWDAIKGKWNFQLTAEIYDKKAMQICDDSTVFTETLSVELRAPNIVVDLDTGMTGTFTLVYDQGFEMTLNNRKYWAYFYYTGNTSHVVSYCGKTFVGSYHLAIPNAHYWGCYKASKPTTKPTDIHRYPRKWLSKLQSFQKKKFYSDENLVKRVNSDPKSTWKATTYNHFNGKSMSSFGQPILKFRTDYMKKFHDSMPKHRPDVSALPDNFDWRNISGVNFVNPVRDQMQCGSCYSFASTGMLSARTRVQTKNEDQTIYSPQEVVDCSLYSQGCQGGFSYLIAGKYAEDFGVVDEKCYPYAGSTDKCQKDLCKDRTYSVSQGYCGGYYGGVTEEAMQLEVYEQGPIAVAFLVKQSLRHYKQGVYNCEEEDIKKPLPPHFVATNHAVQVVGWGVDQGVKYWIVKNSWGKDWGNGGYFWIRRGTNECAIETAGFAAIPLVGLDR